MASFDFNPITGQLDLVGAGGTSYINGVVADPTALPVTLGTPALDSVYLCKAGSGVWLINRRPAGLYVRVANNGVAADWTYLGAFPEVNADGNWELYNSTDPTKELKFDLSGLPTGTTRTVTGPAGNGQMMVSGQAGSFTTLTANNGTLTASAPVLDLAQTWNNAAVTFRGVNWSFVETAAAGISEVFRISTGAAGASAIFNIRRDGNATFANGVNVGVIGGTASIAGQNGQWRVSSGGAFGFCSSSNDAYSTMDVFLSRDAADTIAQRRTTNPQTFNIYNTFTSATNHERGFLRWSSNVFQVGTEKGSGGGSARALEFQTDGTTRFGVASDGNFYVGSSTYSSTGFQIQAAANRGGIFVYEASIEAASSAVTIRGGATSTDWIRYGSNRLMFNGTTSSFPALKRSSATLQVRLADDSAFAAFECAGLTLNGNLTASTRNIVTDTTTGTRIGTATNQLLGFFGATPVAQQAAVADSTDTTNVATQLNALLARLRTLGLIAT